MAPRIYGLHFQDQSDRDESNDLISGWYAGNGVDLSDFAYAGDGAYNGDGGHAGDGAFAGDGASAGDGAHTGGEAIAGYSNDAVGRNGWATDSNNGPYYRLQAVSRDMRPGRARPSDPGHSQRTALLDDVGCHEHIRLSVRPANVIDMPFTPRLTKPTPSSEAWKLVFLVVAFTIWISTAGTLLFFYMDRYLFG